MILNNFDLILYLSIYCGVGGKGLVEINRSDSFDINERGMCACKPWLLILYLKDVGEQRRLP